MSTVFPLLAKIGNKTTAEELYMDWLEHASQILEKEYGICKEGFIAKEATDVFTIGFKTFHTIGGVEYDLCIYSLSDYTDNSNPDYLKYNGLSLQLYLSQDDVTQWKMDYFSETEFRENVKRDLQKLMLIATAHCTY